MLTLLTLQPLNALETERINFLIDLDTFAFSGDEATNELSALYSFTSSAHQLKCLNEERQRFRTVIEATKAGLSDKEKLETIDAQKIKQTYRQVVDQYHQEFNTAFAPLVKKNTCFSYSKFLTPLLGGVLGEVLYKKYGKHRLDTFLKSKKWTKGKRESYLKGARIIAIGTGALLGFFSHLLAKSWAFDHNEKDRLLTRKVFLFSLPLIAEKRNVKII